MDSNYNEHIEKKAEEKRNKFFPKINNAKDKITKAKALLRELLEEMLDFRTKNNVSNIQNAIDEIDNDDKNISYKDAIEIYCRKENLTTNKITDILIEDKAYDKIYEEVNNHAFPPKKIPEENQETSDGRNPAFTTARQVLAMRYLLSEVYEKYDLNIENFNQSEIVRCVQFLTGKQTNVKKIQDTRLYKKWNSPLNITDKAAEQDLNYIRKYFENMGLNGIVVKIDKEIKSREE